MLTDFIKAPHVLKRLRAGVAGAHLNAFTDWLEAKGYSASSVRLYIWGIDQFAVWASDAGLDIQGFGRETVARYRRYLESVGEIRHRCGKVKAGFVGVQYFVDFLVEAAIVPEPTAPTESPPTLLEEFRRWMTKHKGVRESTLRAYAVVLSDFLGRVGECAEEYDATAVRRFVLARSREHGLAKAKATVTAVRVFLRFLISSGRCPAGLDGAVPVIAYWRLSSLPRYIDTDDVERLIASCDDRTVSAVRDKAILLLLARLALRAGDVAGLTFDDIDWTEARIRVSGKNRKQVWLPLTQEVGDAILAYLEESRPHVEINHVFVKAVAPYGPLSSELVSSVVRRAVDRSGVDAPSRGAHLLRHSAATAMLRAGATLDEIGSVLRHASISTTYLYSKVDHNSLRTVVSPWPKAPSDLDDVPGTRVSEISQIAQHWPEELS